MKGAIKIINMLTGKVKIIKSLSGTIIDTCAPFHPHARITEQGQVRITEEVETRLPD